MQFGMIDDNEIKDPFDRLDDLEMFTTGLGLAAQDMSHQLKHQSELGVKISGSLLDLIKTLDILASKIRELECRLEQLENK
jgi:hypothetical protein